TGPPARCRPAPSGICACPTPIRWPIAGRPTGSTWSSTRPPMAGCGPCSPKRSEPPAARRLDRRSRRPHLGHRGPEKARNNGLSGAYLLQPRDSKVRIARHSTLIPSGHNEGAKVQVLVRDNNVDQALKALKKKMQREGIFREMKLRGHYEKPSEKKAREKAEAIRRARKL